MEENRTKKEEVEEEGGGEEKREREREDRGERGTDKSGEFPLVCIFRPFDLLLVQFHSLQNVDYLFASILLLDKRRREERWTR